MNFCVLCKNATQPLLCIAESSPAFAVITSAKLALKAGLDCLSGIAYYRVNHDVLVSLAHNDFCGI